MQWYRTATDRKHICAVLYNTILEYLPPWYNWNIVESGVKHQHPNLRLKVKWAVFCHIRDGTVFANRVCKRTALTEINGHTGEYVDYQRKNTESENGVLQGQQRTTFLIRSRYKFFHLRDGRVVLSMQTFISIPFEGRGGNQQAHFFLSCIDNATSYQTDCCGAIDGVAILH